MKTLLLDNETLEEVMRITGDMDFTCEETYEISGLKWTLRFRVLRIVPTADNSKLVTIEVLNKTDPNNV